MQREKREVVTPVIVRTIAPTMSKEFKPYPKREIRMADEVWEEFKRQKVESGMTWNNFIKSLNKTADENT